LNVIDQRLRRIVWTGIVSDGSNGDKAVQLFASVYDNLLFGRIFADYVVVVVVVVVVGGGGRA
jgi:hypothetical protein